MNNLKIILAFLIPHITIKCEEIIRVTTPLGVVEGEESKSLYGRKFYSFQGVPYGKPPVGENRFKEPIAAEAWSHVWVAKTNYECMQYNQNPPDTSGDWIIGDEDCLYLNIFTSTLNPVANLDVIVYIHGGAFMFHHGGTQDPDYILDRDVVYVNLRYRVGPLGFLSTEDETVPGNNGIKDQILALKWIKNNIVYFGGNPNSVTITGMSAGGASVHAHYLAPASRDLFHKGISQSGTTLNPWVFMENPLEKTKRIASLVGCPSEVSSKEIVDCLRTRTAKQIVETVGKFQSWLYNPFSPFGLVVDSNWTENPVFTDHPYNLLKNGRVTDKPWIVSHTSSEGLYPAADFYHDRFITAINQRWNELIPLILDYNYTIDSNLQNNVSRACREHYLGANNLSKTNYLDFVRMISDRIFIVGISETVKLQATFFKSPIHVYLFTYRGAHSLSEARSGSDINLGASHGDDTGYVFKMFDTTSTEQDRKMIEFMLGIVTSFAKTGSPNVGNVTWSPVESSRICRLRIDSPEKISMENYSYEEEENFWNRFPFKENKNLMDNEQKTIT